MAVNKNTNESNDDTQQVTNSAVTSSHANMKGVNSNPLTTNKDKTLLSKLNKKWVLIATGVLILLVVLLFAPIFPRQLPKVSDLQPIIINDASIATKFESPQALVQRSAQDLGGMVREATENNGSYGLDSNGLAVYKLPYYALKGRQFSVQPTEAYGIAFDGDLDRSEVNYQKLVTFFDTNHFGRLAENEGQTAYIGEDKAVKFVSYAVYVSGEQLCAIWRANTTVTPGNAQRVSVGCAALASYEKAADAASPFHESYSKTDGKHDSILVFGAPEIAKGANGYQRAALYQEDSRSTDQANSGKYAFQAIYYKAPNSKTWQYFGRVSIDTDEIIECSKVNTDALRQAFSGLNCYDKATKKYNTI